MGTISMLQLGLPHATVINKMDLLHDHTIIDDFQDTLYSNNQHQFTPKSHFDKKYRSITNILRNIVVEHDLVSV